MGDPPIKSNVHRHPNPPQVLAGRPIIRSIQFLRCDYFSFLRPTLTAEQACSSLDSNNNTKWCLIQEEADWLLGRLRELNLKSWAKLIKAEFLTRFLCPIKSSKPINLREDINRKKTFSFGHCPNHLTPPLTPPTWSFFSDVKIQDLKVTCGEGREIQGGFFWLVRPKND